MQLTSYKNQTALQGVLANTAALLNVFGPNNDIGRVTATNVTTKFRESFETYTPGQVWTEVKDTNDLVILDGNTIGSSYLVISKSPLDAGTETSLSSVAQFNMPLEAAFGISMSQRTIGQDFAVEIVDVGPDLMPTIDDLAIASIQQASTTLTIVTSAAHNFTIGQRIGIYGVSDSRLNYPSLVVTSILSPTSFLANSTPGGAISSVTAGPFTSGFVYQRPALGYAKSGTSMIFEQAGGSAAAFYVRAEAGDALMTGTPAGQHGITTGSTASIQGVNLPYAYAFQPTTEFRVNMLEDRVQWADVAVDSLNQPTARVTRTQVIPNHLKNYKVRFRAANRKGLTVPAAKIVSAVKTASATATITTDVPHGLTTSDVVCIYGLRDQTSFTNLVTATSITSIVNATQFTITMGVSSTATSYGGLVARVRGGNLPSSLGYNASILQTATLTGGKLTITGLSSYATTVLVGDLVNLYGVRNATNGNDMGVDGVWRARSVNTTTIEFEPVGWTPPADFVLTNVGGVIITRTDMRIYYVRVFDYERERVEIMNRPGSDAGGSVPVVINGSTGLTLSAWAGTTMVTAGVSGMAAVGGNIADGTAPTANPILVGGITPGNLTKRVRTDDAGGISGPHELLYPGWTFTAGSAVPTDGSSSRTVMALPGRDCEVYVGVTSIGNALNTMQIEGSWDNQTFSVLPAQRVDNFATSNQFAQGAAFTPAIGATYKVRSYGYPFIRIHQTALSTTGTSIGVVRIIPHPPVVGETMSHFSLSASNTTEAAGTSGGALQSGGIRSLNVPVKGSCKVQLILDAFVYATAVPTSSTLLVQGSNDFGGTWTTIPMQPLGGGGILSSISGLGALNRWFSGVWEGDATGYDQVRVYWSSYTAGTATAAYYHGALKLIPVASAAGIGNVKKDTFRLNGYGLAPTTANYVLGSLEASAGRTLRVRKLTIYNPGSMTAAQLTALEIVRTTAVSTGGTTQTLYSSGTANSTLFGGVAKTAGPTITAGNSLWQGVVYTPTAAGAFTPIVIDFTNGGQTRGLEVSPGVANGLALRAINGAAGAAGFAFTLDFTEE